MLAAISPRAKLESLRSIGFSAYRLVLRAEDEITLPEYKGSTFRGAFGLTFRKAACILKREECSECPVRETCVYSYIFETPVPEGSSKMRKYPYAPHPFVIEPPEGSRQLYLPGDTFSFGLVLIGRATNYFAYFIYTFRLMGERGIGRGRGRFTLEEIYSLSPDRSEKLIYDSESNAFSSELSVMKASDLLLPDAVDNSVNISFLTPTRIKSKGELSADLTFDLLVRSLLRRLSLLSYFHCGVELDLDYRELIGRAGAVSVVESDLRWYDWERYSHRQGGRMKLGGFVGDISFEGEIKEFMPILTLGEWLHVGKGTSFGLGKYRVLEVQSSG